MQLIALAVPKVQLISGSDLMTFMPFFTSNFKLTVR